MLGLFAVFAATPSAIGVQSIKKGDGKFQEKVKDYGYGMGILLATLICLYTVQLFPFYSAKDVVIYLLDWIFTIIVFITYCCLTIITYLVWLCVAALIIAVFTGDIEEVYEQKSAVEKVKLLYLKGF